MKKKAFWDENEVKDSQIKFLHERISLMWEFLDNKLRFE